LTRRRCSRARRHLAPVSRIRPLLAALVFALLTCPSLTRADPSIDGASAETQSVGASATAIARDAINPLGTNWLFKVESKTYWLDVADFDTHRVEQVVQLQPRVLFSLTRNLSFLTRPTLVLLESIPFEDDVGELSREVGFGDIELPTAVSPYTGPSWLFGAGPTFVFPAASSRETGQGKWQAGPALVLGWRSPRWLAAIFAQQFFSFAGEQDRKTVSELKVQYFLTRYFRDGWNVGMSPTITMNWRAESGQGLTFPLGLGVGKAVKLSETFALNLSLQLQYMPVHPDELGKEAQIQIEITPVLPPLLEGPLFGG
jgi:hypothetical protein